MAVLKQPSQLNVVNTQKYKYRATQSRKKVLENLRNMVKDNSSLLDLYKNGTTRVTITTQDENDK